MKLYEFENIVTIIIIIVVIEINEKIFKLFRKDLQKFHLKENLFYFKHSMIKY